MREAYISKDIELVAFSDTVAGRGPFADTVDGKECRLVVRGRVKGRSGVRLVVLREYHSPLKACLSLYNLFYPELLFYPQRHRLDKRLESKGRVCHEGIEYPLELQEGLFIVGDVVDVLDRDAATFKAEPDGVGGEPVVVLFSREAFLLGRTDYLPGPDEARGAVMIKSGDTEYIHRSFIKGITTQSDSIGILDKNSAAFLSAKTRTINRHDTA